VPIRRPFARVLLLGALAGVGALAVVGALALRGPGLIAVGLAAALAGCTAAGISREAPAHTRGSALEAAVWAACGTTGGLLSVAGLSTVAGGVVATVAVAAVVVVVAVRLVRGRRLLPGSGATTKDRRRPAAEVLRLPVSPPSDPPAVVAGLPPVSTLTTRALGDEWLRTSAALDGRLTPSMRAALVLRREEALDELERRDPDGFALWLAAGTGTGSDPAQYVRGGPARPGPVADTDAA
jgi:hypothetical protein